MVGLVVVNPPDHGSVKPFTPQRNDDPTSFLYSTFVARRNLIGQKPRKGQREDDIHIHLQGRKYPNASDHNQLIQTREQHPHISVHTACII